jgi:hypothetical protein
MSGRVGRGGSGGSEAERSGIPTDGSSGIVKDGKSGIVKDGKAGIVMVGRSGRGGGLKFDRSNSGSFIDDASKACGGGGGGGGGGVGGADRRPVVNVTKLIHAATFSHRWRGMVRAM